MKILSYKYRYFDLLNSKSYIGTALTTKPCDMSTGYRGSGKPIVSETIEPGTEAKFVLKSNGSNTRCWLTVRVVKPSDKWGRVELEKTVTFDEPLEAVAKRLHMEKN